MGFARFSKRALAGLAGLAMATAAIACEEEGSGKGPAATSEPIPKGAQQVTIRATDKGFEPAVVHVRQGSPAVLTFTRVVESSCVDAVKMPWREEAYELPLNQAVNITIPDTSKAGDFAYSCWMDMVHGRVVIEPAASP